MKKKLEKIAKEIDALPDDNERGGIFIYNTHGSQSGEFDVTDLKDLVAYVRELESLVREKGDPSV